MNNSQLKTAIVHEWFVNYMGSEKVVESLCNILPNADIFSLVDFLNDDLRQKILKGKKANTSIIQKLPFAEKHHRLYLGLFPFAIEQLDISDYNVILSSSHAVAKGVLSNANQLHISYVHTPIRYAWDLYHQYLSDAKIGFNLKGLIARHILHKIRLWDVSSQNRVDYFLANSKHIAKRIKKIYNREADVIYPPVDVDNFSLNTNKDDFYLTAARFVPYKKVNLIVEAFSKMPDKKLVVVGSGPDKEKIKSLAGKNIEFTGYLTSEELNKYLGKAKAFLFAAEEDFGITIVESQACGTPVIAYKTGGASETVIDNQTGILFQHQTIASIIDAVNKFEKQSDKFDFNIIRKHSEQFSRKNFETAIANYINQKSEIFLNQ